MQLKPDHPVFKMNLYTKNQLISREDFKENCYIFFLGPKPPHPPISQVLCRNPGQGVMSFQRTICDMGQIWSPYFDIF